MIFETKFELEQQVWGITTVYKDLFFDCPSCDGGKIKLKNSKEVDCPSCNGKGLLSNGSRRYWIPSFEKLTVGQFQIVYPPSEHNPKDRERVMCYETGIGGGTLHAACDLFPSIELAQIECDKRNRIPETENWLCCACHEKYARIKNSCHSRYRNCIIHGNGNHVEEKAANKHLKDLEERDE